MARRLTIGAQGTNACPGECGGLRAFPRKILREDRMPRYLVERTFTGGLKIPVNADGTQLCQGVVANNATSGVTWVHSYVSADKTKTYCIYDGPNEAAIRETAQRNGLPVDSITPVTVLDPYFYH
jgi:hypothetical protein